MGNLFRIITATSILLGALSCGDGKDDEHNDIQSAMQPTVDVSGAYGVLVVDVGEDAGLRLMKIHNDRIDSLALEAPKFDLGEGTKTALHKYTEDTIDPKLFAFPSNSSNLKLQDEGETETATGSAMQKINESGEIENALSYEKQPWQQDLPEISTIAVSPTGEMYLHFRHSFIYRDAPNNENPWDMANGYQCQIFKVTGGSLNDLLTQEPTTSNLSCIDNQHFIDNWRTGSNEVFQFDSSGNIYYPGSIPDSSQMVVYRVSRDGSESTEMINSQICVQDFLITPLGGVFYTGNTCQDGDWGGTGFFRYVAPDDGGVIEIARDWWDFIFDTKVSEANGSSTDNAVFFGPDPRSASTASWETACLFTFDPSDDDPQTRVANIITCGDNIWSWLWMERDVDITNYGRGLRYGNPSGDDLTKLNSWKNEFRRRCESDDEVFAGGGSQISSIKQDSTGDVFVIGNIRKKIAGTLLCSLEIRGPHCKVDGVPDLYSTQDLSSSYATAKSTCQSNAGTWVDEGWCDDGTSTNAKTCIDNTQKWYPNSQWYDNIDGDVCTAVENGDRSTWWSSNVEWTALSDLKQEFIVQHYNCEQDTSSGGGGDWTNEYKALAKVNEDIKNLTLLSTENEQAIDVWLVNDQVYYSSFDSSLGQYLLNKLSSTAQCIDGTNESEDSCSYSWSNRRCVNTSLTTESACTAQSGHYWSPYSSEIILSNFETYNLAPAENATGLWADGLDFSDNSYKFGTIDLSTNQLSLKTGLTGTLKTIVILSE